MKKLESLNKSKFTVLDQKSLVSVNGGVATIGGSRKTGTQTEFRQRPDGGQDMYIRNVYQTWGSDNFENGNEHYYDTGVSYGNWTFVGTQY